jgi:hypothetical protein
MAKAEKNPWKDLDSNALAQQGLQALKRAVRKALAEQKKTKRPKT